MDDHDLVLKPDWWRLEILHDLWNPHDLQWNCQSFQLSDIIFTDLQLQNTSMRIRAIARISQHKYMSEYMGLSENRVYSQL